ncbi:Uncharacterised protein [Plesiomonas shigelloides]|nr:Uncharacterised protein [Plesiomonas shigelloides]
MAFTHDDDVLEQQNVRSVKQKILTLRSGFFLPT